MKVRRGVTLDGTSGALGRPPCRRNLAAQGALSYSRTTDLAGGQENGRAL